jgi:hypothetical protein
LRDWVRGYVLAGLAHADGALLIAYFLAAIRGLLAAAVLARANLDIAAAIARDLWRQAHQTRAMISHYRRRGDPLPGRLRAWAHHEPIPPITNPQDLRL